MVGRWRCGRSVVRSWAVGLYGSMLCAQQDGRAVVLQLGRTLVRLCCETRTYRILHALHQYTPWTEGLRVYGVGVTLRGYRSMSKCKPRNLPRNLPHPHPATSLLCTLRKFHPPAALFDACKTRGVHTLHTHPSCSPPVPFTPLHNYHLYSHPRARPQLLHTVTAKETPVPVSSNLLLGRQSNVIYTHQRVVAAVVVAQVDLHH